MPRTRKQKPRYAIYDNNVKLITIENESDMPSAIRSFGFECASRCEFDLAMPEAVTYIAIKLNPIKGCREVHHLVLIKE